MISKKTFLSLILVLAVIASLALPLQASADHCWTGFNWACHPFKGTVDSTAEALGRLVVGAVSITIGTIFFAVAAVTNWIIDTTVNITVSPDRASTPSFVSEGWTFTRNLANMFFLVILVFIGLATILRLREYELQRTLPKLIVVALLVNFSGLLVGFVADAGNIATIFFTQSLGNLGSASFHTIFNSGAGAIDEIFDNADGTMEGFAGALGLAIALGFFFLFAIVAYLAIAYIFFLRLIILWTLTILAPLAFLSYILPATRSWWNRWFSSLIQWAFVTVPLAFFMWLANKVLNTSTPAIPGTPPLTGTISGWSDTIGAMISPFVAIVLLLVGVGMSTTMSGTFQKVRRWTGTATAVGAGVLGANYLRDKFKQRVANSKVLRKMETLSAGQANSRTGRVLSRIPGVAAGSRFAGRQARGRARESTKKNIGAAETAARGQETNTLVSKLKGRASDAEKVGMLNEIIKRGDIDDARDAGLTNDEIVRIRNSAQPFEQHKDIDAAVPHLVPNETLQKSYAARELTISRGHHVGEDEVTEAEMRGVTPAQIEEQRTRLFRRMSAERVKRMSRDAVKDTATVDAMLKGWDGRQAGSFATEHGREGIDPIQQRLETLATTGPRAIPSTDARVITIADALVAAGVPRAEAVRRGRMRVWLQTDGDNDALAKYLSSQGGQNLGFSV